MIRLVLLNVFSLAVLHLVAQTGSPQYIDSLENELRIHQSPDTNRVIVLYRLCWEYRRTRTEYADSLGQEALKLSTELDFKKGIGASYNNLGGVYEVKGDDIQALKYYLLALEVKRASADPKSIASTLNNIGIIYKRQEYYDIALKFYREAAVLNEQTQNKRFLASNYHNMGNCHKSMEHYDSAYYYYNEALLFADELNLVTLKMDLLTAKGNAFLEQMMPDSASNCFDSTLVIAQRAGIEDIKHFYYNSKGKIFLMQNNFDSAGYYIHKAWEIVQGGNDWNEINDISSSLANYYSELYKHDPKAEWLERALHYLDIAYQSRDSLVSQKRQNSIFNMMMADAVKQKDDEIKAIEQEKELVNLRADNERLIKNYMIIIAIAVAFLLAAVYLRFRKNKKLTLQLSEQKSQIESKNKEIIASITYAKRLQDAILPPVSVIRQFFPEAFVLYLPKDIVAGDFYWTVSAGDNFYIAAADCTGHGVPGAMVSVVCANALERTVNEFGIRDTGKILDKTRDLVLQTFVKSEEMVNDGMDISLVSISINPNSPGKIQWSGANNPLWIVSDGALTELKPDKQPIGRFEHATAFSKHETTVAKGSMLYLFTDGYADQFGGAKGKKFKYAQLAELLIEISALPAEKQQEVLAKKIKEWRGNIEQIDDICIVGIRV